MRIDTLVPTTIAYSGYRLHLRDIVLLKQRKDKYLIGFTVVNTGARPLSFGPGFPQHFLQTDFEETLVQSGLLPLAPGLRAALLASRLDLDIGQSVRGVEHWVTADTPAQAVIARTDAFDRSPSTAVRRRDSATTLTASSVVTPETTSTDVEKPSVGSVTKVSMASCVDIAVASLTVTQRQRGSVMLQIEITNLGPASLTTVSLGSGATLDLYLGGASTVTNASQRIARVNLSSRLGPSLNTGLATGASITLLERIDVSAATRYTKMLVAQIDPGQVIAECDETNNEASLLLKL